MQFQAIVFYSNLYCDRPDSTGFPQRERREASETLILNVHCFSIAIFLYPVTYVPSELISKDKPSRYWLRILKARVGRPRSFHVVPRVAIATAIMYSPKSRSVLK